MNKSTVIILGSAVGLFILSRRHAETSRRSAETALAPPDDREWMPALLSEYHPDAPSSEQAMEGGKYDRNPREKTLVITVQQFQQDRAKYPYVSVSGDLVLRGKKVSYGTRIYFGSYPDFVFRLVDTGQRFYGPKKKIRKPGYEPFDIATDYASNLGFAGKTTVYWIDRKDTLPMKRAPNVA